jgi:5-methylcytosine-specific restriction endonuclease McrA
MGMVRQNMNFKRLGYNSYAEYLSSHLWQTIRQQALYRDNGLCRICHRPASCVHHFDYRLKTMKGENPHCLVSLCDDCHYRVEFDGDKKRTLSQAQKMLALLTGMKKRIRN